MWGYDYKSFWYEAPDFLLEYCEAHPEQNNDDALRAFGYGSDANLLLRQAEQLQGPLTVFQQSEHATLPRYLVRFFPSKSYLEYFVCENIPSLIELLNKLTPLIQTMIISDQSIMQAE
ncbi:hypothetical protein [Acinetobacter larvae]|uniref:Uncharacterized protein n=1 Tax=Acinetobacter larvae TaxID=1789224 RepID=A0A1B2M038_9GAMM|nr:hypothetical protein [Acinetobacter larvae]AOA58564.1 hypothetical protein BFG52_09500 [Acinetobacter larvae]